MRCTLIDEGGYYVGMCPLLCDEYECSISYSYQGERHSMFWFQQGGLCILKVLGHCSSEAAM